MVEGPSEDYSGRDEEENRTEVSSTEGSELTLPEMGSEFLLSEDEQWFFCKSVKFSLAC